MSRSIVSEQAGTTRDYISEYFVVEGGQQFRLIDTAGLRLAEEGIEIEGIKRRKIY